MKTVITYVWYAFQSSSSVEFQIMLYSPPPIIDKRQDWRMQFVGGLILDEVSYDISK